MNAFYGLENSSLQPKGNGPSGKSVELCEARQEAGNPDAFVAKLPIKNSRLNI